MATECDAAPPSAAARRSPHGPKGPKAQPYTPEQSGCWCTYRLAITHFHFIRIAYPRFVYCTCIESVLNVYLIMYCICVAFVLHMLCMCMCCMFLVYVLSMCAEKAFLCCRQAVAEWLVDTIPGGGGEAVKP